MKKQIETKSAVQRQTPQEVHLADYMDILLRRKWVVISFFFIIVGITTTASFLATPQYEATAQILLGGQPTPMNPAGDTPQRLSEVNLFYQTQINLLSSKTLARTVIEKLELQKPFMANSEQSSFSAFASSLLPTKKDKTETERNSAQQNPQEGAGEESSLPETSSAPGTAVGPQIINWYLRNLRIDPIPDSSLVNVAFIGPDAKLITQIVNTHAKAAIQRAINRHQAQAKDALDWLKEQIARQKKEVEDSQRAIYNFKKQHNALTLEDNQIIFSQDLQEINSALTRAKSDRIVKEATYRKLQQILRTHGNVMQMPEFANDPVLLNLKNQLVRLVSQKIEMSTKYGPKHPKMIELSNGIDQIKKEINNEEDRVIKGIKTELDKAAAIEASINRSLDKQKQIAMSLGERAIEYDVLKQQADSTQDIYDFLLKQSEQLGLSSAISSSNMHIVDKAEVPVEPVSPRIMLNIFLSIMISLFVGTGLAFFLEYLDNTVKTPLDIAVKLDLPVLGMVPFHKALQDVKGKDLLLKDKTTPEENNTLPPPLYHISNRLPHELRSPADGLDGRVLIVESVTMNEGKTTVISQIASNLTDAGLRVLLVDCDFQRPSLEKLFHVSNGGGLGKSIDRIMSHHLNSGSLDSYSVDDLFFLISLKKSTGHLIIKSEDQTLVAYFQNGVLIHIQKKDNPENNRIGTMLLNGGFITTDQLNDALRRHQRTGQPLGYILVNAGYISREKLRGPLRLQIEEYLQKMFSWKKGNFTFKPGMVQIYENEKIFFEENYTPMINNLGRIESSKFIEKELFDHITGLEKENLYLLPAGSAYKLIGALNQILMKKIFEKLKHHFDVLLVDTPPLDAASGIESIFPLADGLVLVIKAGHLSFKIINGALNHLPQDKIIGAVLNQAKIDPHPYYY
ncbi:lipopolysaccharide biosynthesis protein [Desulfosarcina variabilis str. Montpellier]|uniref:DUF4388 domain-containing protein n=1 Tax=Desulfosarcina variabilis TaxID=2300 RepID=UPI003AFA11DC